MPSSPKLVVARRARTSLLEHEAPVDPLGRVPLTDDAIDVVQKTLYDQGATDVTHGQLQGVALLNAFARHLVVAATGKTEDELGRLGQKRLAETFGEQERDAALEEFDESLRPDVAPKADREPGEWLSDSVTIWFQRKNSPIAGLHKYVSVESEDVDARLGDVVEHLRDLLRREVADGEASGEGVLDILEDIITNGGDSLEQQLEYVQSRYAHLMDDEMRRLALRVGDTLAEEKERGDLGGPPPDYTPDFHGIDEDGPRFSSDADWMPRLVLVAKNAHVWLSQLRRRWDRDIYTLDQIPDEELDRLAERGISGLWLIGIWERCDASKRIKRMAGNERAEASAYSLEDYRIADALGGEEAYRNLRERAWNRGVRLAADMVPNHMGVTSRWVREEPDWFLSLEHPPYPAYSFTGPDLCDQDGLTIQIDDHYFDHTDAAVVFKRIDHRSGDVRYIYHGNDGTSTPWNDTAQIDYLNAEAREAVIEQIVDVARKFPIIRFDAAMTLVKKHIQRLWFPQPGHGGAIPSRSRHGMTRERFDELMPREFWREVVDRISEEAPDTLLLAEAFWMLEGYFVRNLGMHRVYNSAFMHKLRDEDNAGYREMMVETLTFDPQILRRYVNFMNNPDEETAVEQFGDGDKYFGVCTLMATLPGLPLVGHGQVEGLQEKYGMEFVEPRIDETPNEGLVARHELQIFPLFRRRELFADVEYFRLYEPEGEHGDVLDDVFAYSNGVGDERALVLYHNRHDDVSGYVKRTVEFRQDDELVRRDIAEGLAFGVGDVLRGTDLRSGLEYVYDVEQVRERGLPFSLGPYETRVFMDARVVADEDGRLRELAHRLHGRGVESVERELKLDDYLDLHQRVREEIRDAAGEFDDEYPNLVRLKLAACEALLPIVEQEPESVDAKLLRVPIGDVLGEPEVELVVAASRVLAGVEQPTLEALVEAAFEDARDYLGVNEHEGERYFAREPFEALLELLTRWLESREDAVEGLRSRAVELRLVAQKGGYRAAELIDALEAG
ncbi:MAG: alpha-amylase family glycosyl hydrolase [Myxococcota bacterium]